MVQLPTPEELQWLKGFKAPSCLTIYLPHIETNSSGSTNPDQIELKNLLAEAAIAMLNDGVGPGDVDRTLRPARELLDDYEFWPPGRTESIALFMHSKLFRRYQLPGEVPYMLSIGHGFSLQPLEDIVRDNRSYLVLALSHKHVRMYEGDRFHIRRLALKHFPADMEASLNIDEYPKAWETHAIAQGGEKGSEAFHGQYNERETDKEMLVLFFRKIDSSLRKFLQRKHEPLIIAGVEYLLPIYRQVNTSPYLVPGGLTGNFEHERPEKIRDLAWSLLKQERRSR